MRWTVPPRQVNGVYVGSPSAQDWDYVGGPSSSWATASSPSRILHPAATLPMQGFDVRPGRAAVAESRLISWLQMFAHDRGGAPPVGQLVVAWRDEDDAVAELEHLEYRPQAPHRAVEHLVLVAIHGAADAGARWIEHRLDDVDRLGPGLPWQAGNGVARLDAADIP